MSSSISRKASDDLRFARVDATNRIHILARSAQRIAEDAGLRFLAYLLGMVVRECEPMIEKSAA